MVELGLRLAALRGRRSQAAVALEAGVDVSTISRIETGKIDPSIGTLSAIARALGVSIHTILDPDDSAALPRSYSEIKAELEAAATVEPEQNAPNLQATVVFVRDRLMHVMVEILERLEFDEKRAQSHWATRGEIQAVRSDFAKLREALGTASAVRVEAAQADLAAATTPPNPAKPEPPARVGRKDR